MDLRLTFAVAYHLVYQVAENQATGKAVELVLILTVKHEAWFRKG
ncbi:MAG TPA: hypothetical protein V6D03_03155 [Candidatus Caenarcaniphilales bacterium]